MLSNTFHLRVKEQGARMSGKPYEIEFGRYPSRQMGISNARRLPLAWWGFQVPKFLYNLFKKLPKHSSK
jgi:hypothetical protein